MKRFTNAILLLLICGVIISTGTAQADPRGIVNGEVDHGHPTVGMLSGGCTGTLIGRNTVLTAAHCVTNNTRTNFTLNGHNYAGLAISHPNYEEGNWHGTKSYDIAIIRLDDPVLNIDPKPLCGPPIRFPRDWPVTIVGYGSTGYGETDGRTKRYGVTHRTGGGGGATYFVTGPADQQLCYGDSGGPALLASTEDGQGECVLGVNSGTYNHCTGGSIHVYTYMFADWINNVAASVDPGVAWLSPTLTREVCSSLNMVETCHTETYECQTTGGSGSEDPEHTTCGFSRPGNSGNDDCSEDFCP